MTQTQTSVVAAFTEDQAHRLSGVSLRQMRYWASDGFFLPSLSLSSDGQPEVRLYSFRDLVSLKVINSLRNDAKIPLGHLREVKDNLAHLGDDMWAKTTLYILGKRVVFDNPETGLREDAVDGQGVLQIPLKVVTGDMDRAVRAMRQRDAEAVGRIDTKRGGVKNPVVAGTRIPVRTIQDFAEAGYTVSEILKQFPTLTASDVEAAISYRPAA